ncbi:LacI family DNA-binding transcriptional regulator [Chelatococcus sp. GCM10030263]|uniref:LacI family DNA-binding transcriptional regulator n=1 Tax=Chelatococcus sp. GCM10030263 TaxID=3273387 RepID=UPI0036096863
MTTIRDVARLAGVSVTTVSNALNTPGRVSPALSARVHAAVEKLGYAPHAAARSLRKRASSLIGMVVADITNPFFSELFEAVENAAAMRGYSMLLCNSGETFAREEQHLAMLRTQRIDGLILAPTGAIAVNRASILASLDVPVVLVDRGMVELGYDAVVLDNRRAGELATAHLLAAGHRRIGLINGPEILRTAADRLQGYREMLLAAGIPFDPDLVLDGRYREAEAYAATLRLLTAGDPPTALFATNNVMTIGVMRAIADAGLTCPQDISVVGIDDFPWAGAFTPRLTTVAQPVADMGREVLDMLIGRMSGARTGPGETRILSPSLIARQSTTAPFRNFHTEKADVG